ncbi:MAG TPA: RNA polymerase factor sigma-54 [Bacteroidia bacterium]|nr:RNA polymerase factor sigma-54 [Bacteroidia bacterium]HRG51654.1 RNA polymerase factor sigma-54 [Bacteroidia bacterium]
MLRQVQSQKLLQKLSPQQIQLMKLLQLPTIALEQRIKEEMELNPALEEGEDEEEEDTDLENEFEEETSEEDDNQRDDFSISDYMDDDEGASYKLKVNNTSPDEERKEIPFSVGVSFQDMLESQLGMKDLDDREYQIALYLIGNLDDDGYLRRDIPSIVDDIAFSQNINTNEEEMEKLLHVIQEFDPAGVGARDLQECLLIQLRRKPQIGIIQLATEVVEKQMDEFSKKHYDKISKKLEIDEEILKDVIHEILKLNPRPGNSMADGQKSFQQVIPDFLISMDDAGELQLTLNSRNAPELRISKAYSKMMEEYSKTKDKTKKEASMFIKQKLDGAKWFIDAIQQRSYTLLYTMNAIMEYQREYFLEGDETLLKPMILKDIAEKVGLDISTISRVANSKYVQTPFGTFLLKTFFSESLSTDSGEEVSTREVKKILEDCIAAESKKKPLTDDKLTKILKEKGYNIARRTIAKYREQLDIPVARLRKEL